MSTTPDGFVVVSREEFFRFVGGPRNIHPRPEPEFSEWTDLSTREIVGRTTPGYRNGWGPNGETPKVYMLTKPAHASLATTMATATRDT